MNRSIVAGTPGQGNLGATCVKGRSIDLGLAMTPLPRGGRESETGLQDFSGPFSPTLSHEGEGARVRPPRLFWPPLPSCERAGERAERRGSEAVTDAVIRAAMSNSARYSDLVSLMIDWEATLTPRPASMSGSDREPQRHDPGRAIRLRRPAAQVFARANEEKSGDRLAGIAARSERERVAAKLVLADVDARRDRRQPADRPRRRRGRPADPRGPRSRRPSRRSAGLTVGEFREFLLDDAVGEDRARGGSTGRSRPRSRRPSPS